MNAIRCRILQESSTEDFINRVNDMYGVKIKSSDGGSEENKEQSWSSTDVTQFLETPVYYTVVVDPESLQNTPAGAALQDLIDGDTPTLRNILHHYWVMPGISNDILDSFEGYADESNMPPGELVYMDDNAKSAFQMSDGKLVVYFHTDKERVLYSTTQYLTDTDYDINEVLNDPDEVAKLSKNVDAVLNFFGSGDDIDTDANYRKASEILHGQAEIENGHDPRS